jgi:DNA-binding protein Fis
VRGYQITRALLAMTDLVLNPNRTSKVDPTPVKKAIGKYFQMFAGGQQQDAHEFFLNCVMKVEDELYPLLKQGRLSQTDAAAQKLQTIRKKLKKQKGKKLKEKSEKKEDDDATKHALSMMFGLLVLSAHFLVSYQGLSYLSPSHNDD